MGKKTIAVIFGGCSPEYGVSLHSAYSVLDSLDADSYDVVPVGITRGGDWFRYLGGYERIRDGSWADDPSALVPVAVSPNRSVHGLLELADGGVKAVPVDLALPILHGKNGEDGTVQGMFELAGIAVAGCGTMSSALCMDKDRAHRLAESAGVAAPRAVTLHKRLRGRAADAAKGLRCPLFVKPVRAGSSYGVSRISSLCELEGALDRAFRYDDEAIIEENVDGFEVGCAVMGIGELTVGRVDEVELAGSGFFDYEEKYHRATAKIHMPARIDPECEARVCEAAKTIYRALGCSGFARVDLFLTPGGGIVFNEVNTIPGLTEMSRFPSMMKGAGLTLPQLLDKLIRMYI